MGIVDKVRGEDGGGRSRWRRCGPKRIAATEIREDDYGGRGDAGMQQKRCGTTKMAFWGKPEDCRVLVLVLVPVLVPVPYLDLRLVPLVRSPHPR